MAEAETVDRMVLLVENRETAGLLGSGLNSGAVDPRNLPEQGSVEFTPEDGSDQQNLSCGRRYQFKPLQDGRAHPLGNFQIGESPRAAMPPLLEAYQTGQLSQKERI